MTATLWPPVARAGPLLAAYEDTCGATQALELVAWLERCHHALEPLDDTGAECAVIAAWLLLLAEDHRTLDSPDTAGLLVDLATAFAHAFGDEQEARADVPDDLSSLL